MPKQRKFATALADLAPELASRTKGLREQPPATAPPAAPPPARPAEAPARPPETPATPAPEPPAIPRSGGRLLFLEPSHNRAIEQIHWATRADRQDIIRAALDDFLRRHFDGQAISPQGARLIEDYRRRIHPQRPRRKT